MKTKLLGCLLVFFVTTITSLGTSLGTSASAGGWALTTVDSVPTPHAGQTLEIGFTIRQHGVTLVNLDGVAVIITTSNRSAKFEARQFGSIGHYVADVTFPEADDVSWSVEQGWFGVQELGKLTVSETNQSASSRTYAYPLFTRLSLAIISVLFTGYSVTGGRRFAKRRTKPTVLA